MRQIRSYDFSAHSDRDLADALDALKPLCRQGRTNAIAPQVFAIVDEAIRRRLGAWRMFDPDFDTGPLNRYQDLADRLLAEAPYRARVDFYTDPGFFDGESFAASLEPTLGPMGLDGGEKAIVGAIVCVAEKRKTGCPSNIPLPADSYRALSAKDAESVLQFDVADEQLMAGLLLYEGHVVEMDAGEGKTIAAAFPAVLHALSGRSVHVITANDYLAGRDADWLAPVYESLGLTVDAVLGYMSDEERRHSYRHQIVYGTLREFGFDFLRDNLKLPPDEPVQGALQVAIVDEADHVLLDQARTPLIISGDPAGSRRAFDKARRTIQDIVSRQSQRVAELEIELQGTKHPRDRRSLMAKLMLADPDNGLLKQEFARDARARRRVSALIESIDFQDGNDTLVSDLFYVVDARLNSIALTEAGQDAVERRLGPVFDTSALEHGLAPIASRADLSLKRRRQATEQLRRRINRRHSQMNQVYQMLRAHVLLEEGVDYVVTDGRVVLVDELTGRTLPDNRYQHGLHAALEAKERVTVQPECETLAQVSVQGFMSQYSLTSGMTGTAVDSTDEFEREYGMTVVRVPPGRPSRRTDFGARLYRSRADKLAAVVDEVRLCRRVGRPVLVGTVTVEQSEEISRLLDEQGVEHRLLNAVNSSTEADIVKSAGAFGAVTIATNMAGRGTDIVVEASVDDRVVAGFVDLVEELLDGGAGRVQLTCPTDAEAEILLAALLERRTLAAGYADHRGQGGRPVLLANRESTSPPYPLSVDGEGGVSVDHFSKTAGGEASVSLEFGLGLYVVGTEMNQSRRADRQLRGRSGRQGAFGASRLILSLEDRPLIFHRDSAAFTSDGGRMDSAGRTFFEGPRLERELAAAQTMVEREDEVQRGLVHEHNRVLETQTLAYYRARREVIESRSFHETCRSFARPCAARLVERHFPNLRFDDYEAQFDGLVEELWLDFEIDCDALFGTSLPSLARRIGEMLLSKLQQGREAFGDAEFSDLEKLLFLQSSDELWKDHISEVSGLLQSISLGIDGHKAAMAEYAIRSFEVYGGFTHRVADAFLAELLTFSADSAARDKAAPVAMIEDAARILAPAVV